MIKVPATPEIPAIEELIAEGVNVNITLMFSMRHYEAVARATFAASDAALIRRRSLLWPPSSSVEWTRWWIVPSRLCHGAGASEDAARQNRYREFKMVYNRFLQIFHGEGFVAMRQQTSCSTSAMGQYRH